MVISTIKSSVTIKRSLDLLARLSNGTEHWIISVPRVAVCSFHWDQVGTDNLKWKY